MRAAVVAMVALLVVVPACGEEGGDISEAAAIQLDSQVQDLRRAAANGSRQVAAQELAELRNLVDELSAAGELDADGERRILSAADEVEANLDLLDPATPSVPTSAEPTTTTTTTSTPPTTEEPPSPPKDQDKQDQDKEEGDGQENGDGEEPGRPGNGNRPRE